MLHRIADTAARLDAAGLWALATLLVAVPAAKPEDRPLRLLAFTHAAVCHAAMAPHVPFIEPVDEKT